MKLLASNNIVQSLNSPFRAPYLGVEPWRAKRALSSRARVQPLYSARRTESSGTGLLITLSDNLKEIVPLDFQNHRFEYELEWSVRSLFPQKQSIHLVKLKTNQKAIDNFFFKLRPLLDE